MGLFHAKCVSEAGNFIYLFAFMCVIRFLCFLVLLNQKKSSTVLCYECTRGEANIFKHNVVVDDEYRLYTCSVGFKRKSKEKNGRKMKGQIAAWYKHKYKLTARKHPFIRQLKLNYLATYTTILNKKTIKTTEQDIKVCENNQRDTRMITTTQHKYKYKQTIKSILWFVNWK